MASVLFVLYLEALARKGECMLIRISEGPPCCFTQGTYVGPKPASRFSFAFLAVGPRYPALFSPCLIFVEWDISFQFLIFCCCFGFFCGTRASHRCGLSHCGAQAPDTQAQRPWLTGPAAPRACGIFPDQGTNPCPLHRQADPQPLHYQGSPERDILKG